MMRQTGYLRLISATVPALAGQRSYALATRWRSLAKRIRVWTAVERVSRALARRPLRRLRHRQDAVWRELVVRFEPIFRDVLTASGCPRQDLGRELLFCLVRLQDLLSKDSQSVAMPEMMWRASCMGREVPEHLRSRLRARFHLRALLDELPASDARAAVRFFVFSTGAESLERRGGAGPVDAVYDLGGRNAVVLGLEQFAVYLYRSRDRLERDTDGAIRADDCTSLAASHRFVCDSLLND